MKYLSIIGCILFTVYGQLIIKWRMNLKGSLPEPQNEKLLFLVKLFFDPWIVTGFLSALVASLFWMTAMTKFELSFAYPFMSLSFVIVFFLSIFFFGEVFTIGKVFGLALIVLGLFVFVRL